MQRPQTSDDLQSVRHVERGPAVGYATEIERHWLEIVQRNLPVEHLPKILDGARLAQISDLHVGPQVDDDYLIHSFDRVRALAPDIVVITGDFLTHRRARGESQYAQLRGVLAHLPHGRLATLGILGNHDYGHGWGDAAIASKDVAEAERAGVRVLRNESQAVAGIDFVGVDDLWSHRGDPPAALEAPHWFRCRTGATSRARSQSPSMRVERCTSAAESGTSFVRASWCDRRLRCSRCAPLCMQRSVRPQTPGRLTLCAGLAPRIFRHCSQLQTTNSRRTGGYVTSGNPSPASKDAAAATLHGLTLQASLTVRDIQTSLSWYVDVDPDGFKLTISTPR